MRRGALIDFASSLKVERTIDLKFDQCFFGATQPLSTILCLNSDLGAWCTAMLG